MELKFINKEKSKNYNYEYNDKKIRIIFIDNKFSEVDYENFLITYNREGWKLLGLIEKEISKIEKEYEVTKNATK